VDSGQHHDRWSNKRTERVLCIALSAKRRVMLVIDNLTVRIAGRKLLEGASARIPTGARVGLVGRNSTARPPCLASLPAIPSVDIPARWRIGRLAQEAPNGPDSLLEVVLKADRERHALLEEAETARDPHRIAEFSPDSLIWVPTPCLPAHAGTRARACRPTLLAGRGAALTAVIDLRQAKSHFKLLRDLR
jgi:hypothetical protein